MEKGVWLVLERILLRLYLVSDGCYVEGGLVYGR